MLNHASDEQTSLTEVECSYGRILGNGVREGVWGVWRPYEFNTVNKEE